MKDNNGREYAHFTDVKVGDKLQIDAGFSCMSAGDIKEVLIDNEDSLYIECEGDGEENEKTHHYLTDNDKGYLTGMYKVI